jgi:REP element-mobilizing transposase RayT
MQSMVHTTTRCKYTPGTTVGQGTKIGENRCQFIFSLLAEEPIGTVAGMGRPLRPVADGLVYHAINRGNNRDRVFFDDGDCRAFLRALGQTQQRYPFDLFGYTLMSNHFHLLLRPHAGQSISRILQSLTVAHTWRYRGDANPYDRSWELYFEERLAAQMANTLTGWGTRRYLWLEQGGKCLVCGQPLAGEEEWHIHHLRWRVHGGGDTADNLVLLHANCHRQVHSEGKVVAKAASREGRSRRLEPDAGTTRTSGS